jgi:hypothetical protein
MSIPQYRLDAAAVAVLDVLVWAWLRLGVFVLVAKRPIGVDMDEQGVDQFGSVGWRQQGESRLATKELCCILVVPS